MAEDLTDVGDVISEFLTGTYTVTRPGAVEFDTTPGKPTEGAASTFTISAAVQPVSGRDLQRLPEGFRAESARTLYTQGTLRMEPAPDIVAIEGASWQVEAIEPWAAGGFSKCIVRKVG